ncbi:MAG: transcription-repair coupling factor [Pseudomonadota bacterium]|jgi:transcription-repair coupling factor (superfamily II helicase)
MLENNHKVTQIKQTITDVTPFLLSKICQTHSNENILITDSTQKINRYFELLKFLTPQNTNEIIIFNTQNIKSVLDIYLNKKYKIILSNDEIFYNQIPQIDNISNYIITLEVNKTIKQNIDKKLTEYGYTRAETVRVNGEFAIRGEIIDIGTSDETGLRVHLFDETIESISTFNFINQVSEKKIQENQILPINFESAIFKNITQENIINTLQIKTIIIDHNTLEENIHNINKHKTIKNIYEITPFI